MIKKILVAYDGSDAAKKAFRYALGLAKPFAAEVIVVSVAQPPEPATMVETHAWLDSASEHYEKDFAAMRQEAKERAVPASTRVVVGHAAEQIVHQAAALQADLIVMGHRGKSIIQRWLLGSVSHRVISHAPCAVLIVR